MSRLNSYDPQYNNLPENGCNGINDKEISRLTNRGTGGLRCCSTFCTGFPNRKRFDDHIHHPNSHLYYRGATAVHSNGDIPGTVVYKLLKWYCGKCKLQDQWILEHEELPNYRTNTWKCRHKCICFHVFTSLGDYSNGSWGAQRDVAYPAPCYGLNGWSWPWFFGWYKQHFPTMRFRNHLPDDKTPMQNFVSVEDYLKWRLHNIDIDPEPGVEVDEIESEPEEGKENNFDLFEIKN